MSLKKITKIAVLTALSVVLTMICKIPFPGGYIHFGDSIMYFAVFTLGTSAGAYTGGLGGLISDLIFAPVYALPTLIIKVLSALTAGFAYKKIKGDTTAAIIGAAFGSVIMVLGYLVCDLIITSGSQSAFLNIYFNLIQAGMSVILALLLKIFLKNRF